MSSLGLKLCLVSLFSCLLATPGFVPPARAQFNEPPAPGEGEMPPRPETSLFPGPPEISVPPPAGAEQETPDHERLLEAIALELEMEATAGEPATETPATGTGQAEPAVSREPDAPGPGREGRAAAASPESTALTPPADPDATLRLNFRDAYLDTILEYLSEAAGLTVIRDAPVEGRITVMSRRQITIDEAVSVLNAALKEKGYAAILSGRMLKVVPLAAAKQNNIPVRSGRDPEAIEPSDRIVTQVIPLRFVTAAQLRQDIAPLMPAYAELAANVSSNSLIITDTEANIRRVVEIVRAVDTAVSVVAEVRVFPLTYANASNLATLINQLFQDDQAQASRLQQQRADQVARFMAARTGGQQPAAAAATAAGSRSPKVTALADARTNTLVVSGPTEALELVAKIVDELDGRPEEEQAVFVYSLKNAKAANMATILNNLFRSMNTGTATGRTTTGVTQAITGTTRGNTGTTRR